MYSGHAGGQVISWENLDEELHYELLYSHWKKVTDITGLDMGMHFSLYEIIVLKGELFGPLYFFAGLLRCKP
jgi:hypothetical protein